MLFFNLCQTFVVLWSEALMIYVSVDICSIVSRKPKKSQAPEAQKLTSDKKQDPKKKV